MHMQYWQGVQMRRASEMDNYFIWLNEWQRANKIIRRSLTSTSKRETKTRKTHREASKAQHFLLQLLPNPEEVITGPVTSLVQPLRQATHWHDVILHMSGLISALLAIGDDRAARHKPGGRHYDKDNVLISNTLQLTTAALHWPRDTMCQSLNTVWDKVLGFYQVIFW